MKAVVWTKYGGPEGLVYREVEKPSIKANEILIKVAAASVFAGDCEIRGLNLNPMFALPMRLIFGFVRPKDIILGQEFSGTIEAVGADVKDYHIGQKIFGNTGLKFGAYAEYLALPVNSKNIAFESVPENISLEQAATLVVGGIEAQHFLNKVEIKEGCEILMNGAGGSIGVAAIQIAKNRGAIVTVVDASEKLGVLKELGADHVIDYRTEDFTTQGKEYDVVFDIVGKANMLSAARVLKLNGRYLLANPKPFHTLRALFVKLRTGVKIDAAMSQTNKEALTYMKTQVEDNRYRVYVDKVMSLSQVPQAHAYVDAGKKVGNLLIRMEEEGTHESN
jgi:NADPH:quinone reductase-like Zn-dependent oxidoreductase